MSDQGGKQYVLDGPEFWRVRIGCLIALLTVVLGLPAIVWVRYTLASRPRPLLTGLPNADRQVVELPDRVEIIRIPAESSDYKAKLADMDLPDSNEQDLNRKEREELSKGFSTAQWNPLDSYCDPLPGVSFRFHRGHSVFEIRYCFMCGVAMLYPAREGPLIRPQPTMNASLLELTRRHFPKAPDLKELIDAK